MDDGERTWLWDDEAKAWVWGASRDGDDGCGAWLEANGDWCANVVVGGDAVTLGPFDTPGEAKRRAVLRYLKERDA